MTKAEKQAERRRKAAAKRQRAFRDRRRGGPARGRWADHKSAFTPAAELGLDRLLLVLVEWLKTFAPDAARDLHRGWLKVGRDERTLQKEITAALDRPTRTCSSKSPASGTPRRGAVCASSFAAAATASLSKSCPADARRRALDNATPELLPGRTRPVIVNYHPAKTRPAGVFTPPPVRTKHQDRHRHRHDSHFPPPPSPPLARTPPMRRDPRCIR